ncbi:hypothetical protein ACTIVE_7228 [Actinomadura verrucosospora]|uniref:Uncharacterized protein n=1 Tax=Actinomadura verrucosospora TaxID=46165 RepID=A0A7D3W3U9_ACTVE|nr:hypothetical protein ACTIVE_7228 [Actinomadura verrucosospora]
MTWNPASPSRSRLTAAAARPRRPTSPSSLPTRNTRSPTCAGWSSASRSRSPAERSPRSGPTSRPGTTWKNSSCCSEPKPHRKPVTACGRTVWISFSSTRSPSASAQLSKGARTGLLATKAPATGQGPQRSASVAARPRCSKPHSAAATITFMAMKACPRTGLSGNSFTCCSPRCMTSDSAFRRVDRPSSTSRPMNPSTKLAVKPSELASKHCSMK